MARKLSEVASRLATKAPQRSIVYIVDYENIPKTDVAELLDKDGVRMVVLAANRTNTVTPATMRTIEANPDRVEVIIGRVTRKEFVDKLVTAKIGEYAFRFPDDEIIVLANDRDYTDLASHLNDHWEREVPIRHDAPQKARKPGKKAEAPAKKPERSARGADRSAKKPEKRPAKKPDTKPDKKPGKKMEITNPDADVIFELLGKMSPRRRPRSASALLNAVRNYREAMGLKSRPTTIIKHLQERGLIDPNASPVNYALEDA